MAPTLLKGKQSRDLSLYDTNRHQPKLCAFLMGKIHSKFTQPKFEPPTRFFFTAPLVGRQGASRPFAATCRSWISQRSCRSHVVTTVKTKEWQQKNTWHLNFTQQKSQNTRWESWKYQFRTNFSFRSFFLYSCENLSWSLILLCWCYRGSQHWKWRRKWATYRPAKNGIPIMVYFL